MLALKQFGQLTRPLVALIHWSEKVVVYELKLTRSIALIDVLYLAYDLRH